MAIKEWVLSTFSRVCSCYVSPSLKQLSSLVSAGLIHLVFELQLVLPKQHTGNSARANETQCCFRRCYIFLLFFLEWEYVNYLRIRLW